MNVSNTDIDSSGAHRTTTAPSRVSTRGPARRWAATIRRGRHDRGQPPCDRAPLRHGERRPAGADEGPVSSS
jgi:hypothetical protein